jgi:hypothetical protein
MLDEIISGRFPISAKKTWDIRSVNTVFENREEIIECLEIIENTLNQNISDKAS